MCVVMYKASNQSEFQQMCSKRPEYTGNCPSCSSLIRYLFDRSPSRLQHRKFSTEQRNLSVLTGLPLSLSRHCWSSLRKFSCEYRISTKKVSTFPSGHLRYKPKTPNLHSCRFGFVNKNMSGFVAVRNMANKPPLSCVASKFFVLTWLLYD